MNSLLLFGLLLCSQAHAAVWRTHFAYSNVEQIAVMQSDVFGLSDGSLYSVNKYSEQLKLWNLSSGLHATDICCIGYDDGHQTLVILYANGKIDLLKNDGSITYVGDLYLEDMTASKRANTIAFHGGLAYLGMRFGVLTFDLDKMELPDAYYVGAEASDQDINAIFFDGNTIYAATDSLLFSAPLDGNLVDFRTWTEQPLPTEGSLYVLWREAKEHVVQDGAYSWRAAGAQGIEKQGLGGVVYYKPDGPIDNNPYRMRYQGGRLYVVPGARWAVQSWNPGQVSYLEQGVWHHITNDYVQGFTGMRAFDFMDVAADPQDANTFFVTSYGTGLYRFRGTTLENHWMSDNSGIEAAAPDVPEWYTRTDGAVFDSKGNLWMMNASGAVDHHICIRKADGTWANINAYVDGSRVSFDTPGEIVISNQDERYKWLPSCRNEAAIVLLDDGGTPFDESDDHSYVHKTWVDQNGLPVEPEFIYCAEQDAAGGLWVGTSNGPLYIPSVASFKTSNACERVRFQQEDGTFLMEAERVNCVMVDPRGRAWIGTQTQGIYVIAADRRSVEMHLLPGTDNPMPSACILSIAMDDAGVYYIGTGGGIVSYEEDRTDLTESPYSSMETFEDQESSGLMGAWTLHFAYLDVTQIAVSGTKAYGLSEGALFSVNRADEEVRYLNRLSGLSDAGIASITHDPTTGLLLVLYANGNIDMLSDEGDVWNIPDLKIKQLSGTSKAANSVCMHDGFAYLAMPFGVMQVSMRRHEIADTYYIGAEGANVNVERVGFSGDSIYAQSGSRLYAAASGANLVDYHVWSSRALPAAGPIVDALQPAPSDTIHSSGDTFIAAGADGIVMIAQNGTYHSYVPNGPATNQPYSMTAEGDRLIVVPGGRWAQEYMRKGNVMVYENGQWFNNKYIDLQYVMDWRIVLDFVSAAIDPTDPHHYYVASYGTGLYEFRNDVLHFHQSYYNTPGGLQKAAADANGDYYTRVDGLAYDKDGNLWMMCAGSYANNVCILATDGTWRSFNFYSGGRRIVYETPGQIVVDKKRPNYKWMPSYRASGGVGAPVGLGLLDDNGTPLSHGDDRMVFYSTFVDQFGYTITPDAIYCISQDPDGNIWLGTNEGVFMISAGSDYFVSNACQRFKINRNDGSGLGDFLLSSESIRAIAHDGGGRHWFGTATNGVFLIQYRDADDVATIHHFTTSNSPLPSNNILSLAIMPNTGEVFIGTESGLASFRSDASEPRTNYLDAYVYPNPVRPEYEGNITFTGLMDNTYVKVLDAAGNLVFYARANGGTAVWDGRNAAGRRVTPGVYNAYLNTPAGGHAIVKILIMR